MEEGFTIKCNKCGAENTTFDEISKLRYSNELIFVSSKIYWDEADVSADVLFECNNCGYTIKR